MKNNTPFPIAVLFDFDGVVVDSFESHFHAWKTAFYEMFQKNIPPFPHEKLSGKSPLLIAEYFCELAGDVSKTEDFFHLKAKHLHESGTPPKLLPGVHEIQNYLKEHNIPHGIASNATRKFIKNSIAQLSLGFEKYLGIEDYQYPKPHPEAYLSLAKELQIKPENYKNVWVFEDSITGTTSAKEAGMIPIGILTLNSEATMKKAGSRLVFPSLFEAWQYIQLQNA
ncbi:HAD family hydrolase [Flavicella sediminum]|uniref:HAD family hydrolase n=1 Tax=Flavicella sediminum TaxID=2585141 RepID=UPI0011212497|nr:HAD family phosphatase [Flavicella sediminum]